VRRDVSIDARKCPACPTDPWVILADVTFKARLRPQAGEPVTSTPVAGRLTLFADRITE